ncbi:MAG TPA: hypothetical protein VFQ61_21395 [Polyangiaceae bacterium]|nr:hypothetical protein [Polyangiaceae bacterium]
MQRIDFYRLERPIQERFIASARGTAAPAPLALEREPLQRGALLAGVVSGLTALAALGLASLGFGNLQSSLALHPSTLLVLYALLIATSAAAAVVAYRVQATRNTLPFAPGIYLFPSGVIDTRGPEFRVRKLSDVARVTSSAKHIQLLFQDGTRFQFKVPSGTQPSDVERKLNDLRSRLSTESGPPSARELAIYDPLCDNGFKNPFSPTEPMRPPRTRLLALSAAVGAVVGAALGAGLWKVRNVLGEDALYRAARETHTRDGYAAYVERGGSNPDVREVLLPRANLAAIVERGSLEEIERFAEAQKGSRVEVEAQAALYKALTSELERAKQEQSFAALKAFRDRYAKHTTIQGELSRAFDERLNSTLAEVERRAHPKPDVLTAFRRLLAYSVDHTPRVEVRFRRRIGESVAKTETLIEKSLAFGGRSSLPAQYFQGNYVETREAEVAKQFIDAFSKSLPPGVLTFEHAPPLEDSPDEDPKVSTPSIVVTHRVEMSGGYLMRKPKAALTGVGVLFRATIQVPGEPAYHPFKYSSWNVPDFKSMVDGKSFAEIYDEMGDKAFAKLSRKYLAEVLPGIPLPGATDADHAPGG